MAVVENRFVCDLSKPVQAQALKGNVFSLDNLGSRLSVLIYNNGQHATISGSITANCILPDGSTVNINGVLTTENGGSKAYVDVPQSCLLIPGILKIAIKCTSSSVITTLAAIVANVYMTKTDNVITPSQQIIDDWNAEISSAIGTQDAKILAIETEIGNTALPTTAQTLTGAIAEHETDIQTEITNRTNADNELKSALSRDEVALTDYLYPTFGKLVYTVNDLNTSTGNEKDTPTGTRLASEFVYLHNGSIIQSIGNVFEFIPLRYDSDKAYVGTVGNWSGKVVISNDGYYRLTARLKASPSGSVTSSIRSAQGDILVCDPSLEVETLTIYPVMIKPTNYSTDLPDANNAARNKIYVITIGSNGEGPAHLPSSLGPYNVLVLQTIGQIGSSSGAVQIIYTETDIFRRKYGGGQWQDWINITSDIIDGYAITQTYLSTITYSNYSSYLPDLNNAGANKRYRIIRLGNEASNSWPAHLPMPWDKMGKHGANMICSIVETYAAANGSGKVQMLRNEYGYWIRHYSSDQWDTWSRIGNNYQRNRVIIGEYGNYTSFSEGIIAAYALGNCDVYVNKGEYNIKTEIETLYGNNVWTTGYDEFEYRKGLPWGNGMRIIGSPGAVLTMDASEIENDDVWDIFSILSSYTGASDDQKTNTVEGIKFNCTCIRYCIHLDSGAVEMDDTYIMDACHFYLDNTDNTTKTFAYCVGMGASINTTFKISNCYVYGVPPANPRDTAYLYFHNTNAASPNDKMIFENNYIDNGGTIRVDAFGESQNKCLVQVCGNSCGSNLLFPTNPHDNVLCLAWNNEIRT